MRDAWQRLQPRERALIGVAGALVALTLAWTAIWEPLQQARREAADRVATQLALLDWLDRIEPRVRALRSSAAAGEPADTGGSLLSVVDETARAAGLAGALRRIEPASDAEVRVDFAGAAFPALMGWLADLSARRPLAVVRLTADRSAPGRVDAVVVLRRGDAAAAR